MCEDPSRNMWKRYSREAGHTHGGSDFWLPGQGQLLDPEAHVVQVLNEAVSRRFHVPVFAIMELFSPTLDYI